MIFNLHEVRNMNPFVLDFNLAVLLHSLASVFHFTFVLSHRNSTQISKPLHTQFTLDEVFVVDEVKYVGDVRGCV